VFGCRSSRTTSGFLRLNNVWSAVLAWNNPGRTQPGSSLSRDANRRQPEFPFASKVKQSRYTPWRRLGGEAYSSYSFSTSTLDGGEWSALRPGCAFTPGERTPGTHCTGGWVGPRAGLDTETRGKIPLPLPGSNPDRPVVQPVVRHYTAWATPASRQKVCQMWSRMFP
jgi:hypothetical protein